jgi:primase-polymerase (primpol)-like protein
LAHLTKLKRWVVWRWELNGRKKWTKPPYQSAYPKTKAKSDDPNTWGTYEAAVAAVAAGFADGIGFMLKDSEVAAGDIDHVRNALTGELVGWAQKLCDEAAQLGLYVEVTVSGGGLRFIGSSAQGDEIHRKFTFDRKSGAGVELYRNCARYITISGLQQGSCEKLGSIDGYIDELVTRYDGGPSAAYGPRQTQSIGPERPLAGPYRRS